MIWTSIYRHNTLFTQMLELVKEDFDLSLAYINRIKNCIRKTVANYAVRFRFLLSVKKSKKKDLDYAGRRSVPA